MLFEIILLAGLGLAGFFLFGKPEPEPIFGVYKEPGKWYYLKYALFYCIMLTRKLIGNFTKGANRTGYGLKSHPTVADMDVAQKLSSHSKAFDAVFFMATTKDGFYLVGGAERRHNGVVNGLFYVAVPGEGLLCSSKIPDTILHGARENDFGAEGIRFIPIEPMKHWRVEFEGDMWHHDDPNKTSKVVVRGDWKSHLPYFDFDTDSNISTMCSAIARESWSREYFEFLKNAHQSHYEQMGTLKATITLDGKEYSLDGQAFRDHSYGFKRDWKLMHRYIFHMLFLEDGTTASIGVICQPCTCSVLKIGYVYKPDGTLYPLEWCDLQLYQHGENGSPPRDHAFSFKAGGTVYRVQVDVEYESIHYKGEEREARMVERFVRYHVNGKIKGRGVSEFHYNNSNDLKRGTV